MTHIQHQQGSTSYRTVRRHLFGGAITAELPQSFIDASELRQVPDNQEVMISSSSDTSIILEVLESVKEGDANENMEAAVRYHFDSLAHDNSALSSTIESTTFLDTSSFPVPPPLPDASSIVPRERTPSPWLVSGLQVVPKYGRTTDPPHCVRIHLAVWRLRPKKDVDLVLSFNIPQPQPQPTAAGETAANAGSEMVSEHVSRDEAILAEVFRKAASTLTIEDWNLFS
ncbi:Mog1p/PsbP-like protein [Tilletiaria anomala UBC 951]|uniref:Mog1p/PsbP-like protein n=1 Tax=Tilletiaria anomala (strain ATCC 24038 / CBS 436.72 / UBC 951) TaxID=1037660 RepID=A0A066VE34_TILAU|nr:Mog1p/PsbP-like protein [Tilletiaria anomala UBC 951]KDN37019.1 Mog1p/PsbP-like protein [Tilletiaria anomala UBC 951]